MKPVIYVTRDGLKKQALVKDSDGPQDGPLGVPLGPPDLRDIDLEGLMKDINNTLADFGLFTWADVQRHPEGMQAALNVLKRELIKLYRQ
jgi:hypothetical protein